VENDGTVHFNAAGSTIDSQVNNRGSMVFGSSSSVTTQALTSSGSMQFNGGSVTTNSMTSSGSVAFSGGSVSLASGQPFLMQLGSDTNGVGAISGNFVNSAGSITHGSDAGTSLDINGGFENSGNIYATIDNTFDAGAGFTQMRITGQARLGGSIYICIAENLLSQTAQVDLLSFSSVVGDFQNVFFECTPQHKSAKQYKQHSNARRSVEAANCSPRTVSSGINFSVLLGGCGGSGGNIDSVEPSWYIVVSVAAGILILVVIIFGGGLCYSEHQRKKTLKKTMKKKRMRMIREETEAASATTSASSGMSSNM
jgi:hypothetical protein